MRFIITNGDTGRIQGDIGGRRSATEAVAAMLSLMTGPTPNASWSVRAAPAGFPAPESGYDGGDAGLQALLRATPATEVPNPHRQGLARAG